MDTYKIIKKIILATCLVLVFANSYSQKLYSDLRWEIDGIYYTTSIDVQDEGLVKEVYVTNTEENSKNGSFDASSKYSGKIVIPSHVNISGKHVPVTGVAGFAFYKSNVKSVILPSSVKFINGNAFNGCKKLERVIMPNVEKLAGGIFRDCERLHKIIIPASLKNINPESFIDIPNLREFIVEKGNPEVCALDGVLYSIDKKRIIMFPSAKETVVFPDNLEVIGFCSFRNSKIRSVDLPSTLKLIEGAAFANAENLKHVVIPNSVDSIGASTFRGCTNLSSVTLSSELTSIPACMFEHCSSLKNIVIPDKVTEVGSYTFSGCTNLTSVILSSELTSIPTGMFKYCKNLRNIVIPDKVTEIRKDAFDLTGSGDSGPMENFTIGRSVRTIDRDALSTSLIKNMYSYAPAPPKIVPELFYDEPPYPNEPPAFSEYILYICKLYVPANFVPLYKSAKEWWNIEHILPMDASVEEVTDSGCDFSIVGNRISVNSEDDTVINIYSIDGILRFSGIGPFDIELPSGFYILKIGNKSRCIRI